MKQILWLAIICLTINACKNDVKKDFTVTGKITNTNGKMVYLEEVPVGTMQPMVVDSATLKSGQFALKTKMIESAIYNIRIDQLDYPIASVINDNPSVAIHVTMSAANNQFPEKFDVTGSPASASMKDFMLAFNNRMMKIFAASQAIDSLHNLKKADSTIMPYIQAAKTEGMQLKEYTLESIKRATNPALAMFILGYYQSTANGQGMGLEPLANDQVNDIIAGVLKNNPNHKGIAALQQTLKKQMTTAAEKSWIGKQAPDFTLPDVAGNPLTLSALKGKYVLVDFWASWCKPCRLENPNVVAAYNKFKEKNFTILGVSLDNNKEAWVNAIKNDKLAWQQVSDLKQWESMVVPLYKFDGIPFNILVDPQGKIIAEGLRGMDLENKLSGILK